METAGNGQHSSSAKHNLHLCLTIKQAEMIFTFVYRWLPIAAAARSKAWTVFTLSNTGIVGSNPTWGIDICVCLFYVCTVMCVQVAALRRTDPPSKESNRLCKRSSNWKAAKQKAVEP
jgi:hypothetical protein